MKMPPQGGGVDVPGRQFYVMLCCVMASRPVSTQHTC